nr:hypothetical protein [Aspergillus cibarius chrysovirus 1]
MSHIKSVQEAMRSAPRLANHEEDYLATVRKMRDGPLVVVDHPRWEDAILSDVERNLMRCCVMKPRFRLSNMHKRFPVSTMTLAKGGDSWALSNLKHTKTKNMSYLSRTPKTLIPTHSHVEHGVTKEPWDPSDRVMARVSGAMPGLGASHITPINSSIITARFALKADMRHVFLKGYLYLMDYTLATASKKTTVKMSGFDTEMAENISMRARLAAMVSRDIVVDVSTLSGDETRMLALLGSQYPVVKYCDDNVYNTNRLEKDDMLLVSDHDINVPATAMFTSPDTFYSIMTSIAVKMDCLDDMQEVFSSFRGLPFLMDDYCAKNQTNTFVLKFPKSRHLRGALELRPNEKLRVDNFSNYFSSTISLVLDMMLGQAYDYSILNMIEGLCANTPIGIPTGDPNTDDVFNDQLRNYGLKSDSPELNALIMEWGNLTTGSMPIAFGDLKTYTVRWVEDIMARGWQWHGIQQVALMMTGSYFKETSIGSQRGWDANMVLCGDEQILHAAHTKAFGFVMGVSDDVPRILQDVDDYLTVPELSPEELDMMMGRAGSYKITGVWFNVAAATEAYADMREVSLVTYHNTRYKGCGFHLVYDPISDSEKLSVISANVEDEKRIMDTLGIKDTVTDPFDVEIEGITFGGSVREDVKKPSSVMNKTKLEVSKKQADEIIGNGYVVGLPAGKSRDIDRPDMRRPPVKPNGLGEIETGYAAYDTKGDGTCGIHGIVQDLAVHGYIDPRNYLAAHRNLLHESVEKDWHTEPELAGLCTARGFGLQAFSRDPGGGWRSRLYGGQDAVHVVRLMNDNGHWSNIVPGIKDWDGGLKQDLETTAPADVTAKLRSLSNSLLWR